MRFGDRSDAELMELAQAGWAPAFAVLVHRYAPVVRTAHASAPDPTAAVADTFLQAMRQLPERDPGAPVGPWLLGLAGASATPAPTPLQDEELDAVWGRLHPVWPDGHRPARRVHWQRTAAVVALAALAGLVPAVVLGTDGTNAGDDTVELRATPLPDERTEQVEQEPEEEEEDVPDFSFPATPEEQEPAPPPEPDEPAEPEPAPGPEPEPAPEPADEEVGTGPDREDGDPDEGDESEESDGLLDGLVPGDEDDEAPEEHQPDEGDDDTGSGEDAGEDGDA